MSDRMTALMQEQTELRWLWADARQLVILMALMRAGGPVGARQIARQLGAHHETVTEKLHSLEAMGMVTRLGVRGSWYLTAAGVLFIQGDRSHGISGWLAADEEQVEASLLCEVNGRTVLRAWEQALRVLQSEYSPGSYQAYLAEARPWAWEAEGRLVVRTPTSYARDWLRERMGRTLERMLCGILDREVRVVFEWEG